MKLVINLALVFLLFSCKKEDINSNLQESQVDKDWLINLEKSMTNCTCQQTLFQGLYSGDTVYFVLMNDPLCNSVFGTTLYNEKGAIIKAYDYNEAQIFYDEVKIDTAIYICKNQK